MFFNFMARWKRPEATRTKAMRSRCCGSILACTLNTKPTRGSSGEIGQGSAGCGRDAGANSPTPVNSRLLMHCKIVVCTPTAARPVVAGIGSPQTHCRLVLNEQANIDLPRSVRPV
jgi:hypothetical protein